MALTNIRVGTSGGDNPRMPKTPKDPVGNPVIQGEVRGSTGSSSPKPGPYPSTPFIASVDGPALKRQQDRQDQVALRDQEHQARPKAQARQERRRDPLDPPHQAHPPATQATRTLYRRTR